MALTIEPGTEPLVKRLGLELMDALSKWMLKEGIDPWNVCGNKPLVFGDVTTDYYEVVPNLNGTSNGDRRLPVRKSSSKVAVEQAIEWAEGSPLSWSTDTPDAVLVAKRVKMTGPLPMELHTQMEIMLRETPQAVELGELVVRWRAAKEQAKALTEAADEARAEILSAMAAAEAEIATADGVPIAKRSLRSGRQTFKSADFRKQYPDLADEFTVKGADYEQLDVIS